MAINVIVGKRQIIFRALGTFFFPLITFSINEYCESVCD